MAFEGPLDAAAFFAGAFGVGFDFAFGAGAFGADFPVVLPGDFGAAAFLFEGFVFGWGFRFPELGLLGFFALAMMGRVLGCWKRV